MYSTHQGVLQNLLAALSLGDGAVRVMHFTHQVWRVLLSNPCQGVRHEKATPAARARGCRM